MRKIVLTLCILIIFVSACKKDKPEPSPMNAGYTFFQIDDPVGDSIWIAMWYPTSEKERPHIYNTAATGFSLTGDVALNAKETSGEFPIVFFSHGFSGGGIGSVEICEELARAGYYVVVPDHNDAILSVRIVGEANGTIADALEYLTNNPFGNGELYEYRIHEMEITIDYLLNSDFHIDTDKIILGGHSMGGWTAMKTMANGMHPEAMFLFSMGELNWLYSESRYFESAFFQTINFPTAYYYGGEEYLQAISAGRDKVYAAYCFQHSPSPSYGLLVRQGNHFTYNSYAVAPGSYGDEIQNEAITSRLINFLDRHVKGKNVVVTNEPEDVIK